MKRLMAADMNSGWGIRTLSTREKSYNPVSYHLGSVWPHENGIIAAGFRQYGFDQAAITIYQGIIDAALLFKEGRLPKLFCGYSRQEFSEPVRYPTACHPQAWGAGTIPFMIQTMLGIQPNAFENKLTIVRPMLPQLTKYITLHGLTIGKTQLDISFRLKNKKVIVKVLNRKGPPLIMKTING